MTPLIKFAIHDMDSTAGLPADPNSGKAKTAGRNNILLPKVANLSVERLTSNGIFLLDNGVDMYLWVGRSSDPAVTSALFGISSLENVDMSQVRFPLVLFLSSLSRLNLPASATSTVPGVVFF